MTIVTMHKFDEKHLTKVMSEAKEIGSVTINVYHDGETAFTLEGVHRIEAAKRLELPLVLVACEWDQMVYTDCEDVQGRNDEGFALVSSIHEYAYDTYGGQVYSDSDFESVEVA